MRLLNINGDDGPILKKFFTCDNCKFLGNSAVSFSTNPYKCYYDDVLKKDLSSFKLMWGDIGENKITPLFCPFIIKKIRNEKLKEINEK